MLSYEDFDLRIRSDGDHFVVHAQLGSQQASEPFEIDPAQCKDLRVLEVFERDDARKEGQALFHALIRGRVRDLYQQSRGHAGRDSASGQRIRLLFDPHDERLRRLIRLPWELLQDPGDANNLLALDVRRPIVRVVDTTEPSLTPSTEKLARVLLALANPDGEAALDLERELDAVTRALARIGIQPIVVKRATRDALFDAIADNEPQIVHFMGHSEIDPETGDGVLLLEDGARGEDRLTGSLFARYFGGRSAPRLVILTSCLSASPGRAAEPFAGIAFALAAAGLPAVIAMQSEVLDENAVRFTERLYRRLADDDPIEGALADARRALSISRVDTLDWAAPVLFMRPTAMNAAVPVESEAKAPPLPKEKRVEINTNNIEKQTNNFF